MPTAGASWNGDNFRTGDVAGRASRGDFRTDAEALAEEDIWGDPNSSNEAIMGILDSAIGKKNHHNEPK
jgi:hypothetical protein